MFEDKNKSILDLQDIFGVLISGVILGVAILASIWLSSDWKSVKVFELYSNLKTAQLLVGTILFLIYAYVLGHTVSMISSLFVKKWVIGKIFGYPLENLLVGISSSERVKEPIRNWFRILTVCIVLSFVFESFDHYCVSYTETTIHYCTSSEIGFFSKFGRIFILYADDISKATTWILGVLVGGIVGYRIISGLHKRMIIMITKTLQIAQKIFKRHEVWKFDSKKATANRRKLKENLRTPLYGLLEIAAIPIRVVEQTIRNIFGLDEPLNGKLHSDFQSKFDKIFKLGHHKELNSEYYWLTRIYIETASSAMSDATRKDASQNSMTRNVSIALFLSALALVFAGKNTSYDFVMLKLSTALLFCSFLLSIWGYYQYYTRSKAVIRRFVSLIALQEFQIENQSPVDNGDQ